MSPLKVITLIFLSMNLFAYKPSIKSLMRGKYDPQILTKSYTTVVEYTIENLRQDLPTSELSSLPQNTTPPESSELSSLKFKKSFHKLLINHNPNNNTKSQAQYNYVYHPHKFLYSVLTGPEVSQFFQANNSLSTVNTISNTIFYIFNSLFINFDSSLFNFIFSRVENSSLLSTDFSNQEKMNMLKLYKNYLLQKKNLEKIAKENSEDLSKLDEKLKEMGIENPLSHSDPEQRTKNKGLLFSKPVNDLNKIVKRIIIDDSLHYLYQDDSLKIVFDYTFHMPIKIELKSGDTNLNITFSQYKVMKEGMGPTPKLINLELLENNETSSFLIQIDDYYRIDEDFTQLSQRNDRYMKSLDNYRARNTELFNTLQNWSIFSKVIY